MKLFTFIKVLYKKENSVYRDDCTVDFTKFNYLHDDFFTSENGKISEENALEA